MKEDLVYRLRKRAEIRRHAKGRKSVEEGQPDRLSDLLEEAAAEIEHLRKVESALVCYEAYQVVGSLLSDTCRFETEEAMKILDNLSQAKLVHSDVLPWSSLNDKADK